ncbi:MAG: lipopolysaccharide biosynthesis protein [Bacteroidia bacterium]|jgi:O-antigen/teichoic acid export membrane protein
MLALSVVLARTILNREVLASIEWIFLLGSILSSALVSSILQAGLLPGVPKANLKSSLLILGTYGFLTSMLYLLSKEYTSFWNPQAELQTAAVAAWLAFLPMGFVVEHALFRHEKSKWLFASSLASGLGYLFLGTSFLWLEGSWSTWPVFPGLAVFALAKAGAALILAIKTEPESSVKHALRPLLFKAWPLMLAFLFGVYSMYLDGIWVATWAGPAAFLLFSYGAKEFPLSQLLANAFSENQLRQFRNQGVFNRFQEEQVRIAWLTVPAATGLMFAAPYLFRLVFGAEFAESAGIFQVYLLLVIPRLFFPQTLLFAYGHSKWALPASMVEWVFNVGCSIWWLHVWDWTAVAWATVLAYLIEKAILFGVLVWKEPNQWRNSIPPAPVLWLLSGLVLAFAAARLWL